MGNINTNLLNYKENNNNNFIDYSKQIEEFYSNYNIQLKIEKYIQSYSITRFLASVKIDSTTKISKIENLVDDLSLYINVKNVKTSIDYETGLIAFEIPQKNRKTLYFKEILQETDTKEGLQIPLGKDLNNNT